MPSTTVSDQIYARLLNSESPTELRKAFRSASAMTKAMQLYLDQTTPRVEALQHQLIVQRTDVQTLQTDREHEQRRLRACQQEIHTADAVLAKRQEQQRHLDTEINHQESRLKQIRDELATASKRLQELRDRGILPELIARIHGMEAKSGSDLLASVLTAQAVHQTQQTLSALQTEETRQRRRLQDLASQLQAAQQTLRDAENQRDDVERDIATMRTSVDVIRAFLESGYSTEDLTSLREGLTLLQLPKEPSRSITRLVMAIQDARTLTQLRHQIQHHEAKLETLQSNLMTVQGELAAYHEHVVGRLTATHAEHQQKFDALLHTVDDRATAATQTITQNIDEIEHSIQRVRDHAAATGDAVRQLEALQPLLVFLDKGTGTPAILLPRLLHLLTLFAAWLDAFPQYRFTLKVQVENVVNSLRFNLQQAGWQS